MILEPRYMLDFNSIVKQIKSEQIQPTQDI